MLPSLSFEARALQDDLVSPTDQDLLVYALARSGLPFTGDDVRRLIDWAAEVRRTVVALDLLLSGRMAGWVDDTGIRLVENRA